MNENQLIHTAIDFNSNNNQDIYWMTAQMRSHIEEPVLLNYPVVYVHTWQDNDQWQFYIGETIDIINRTSQHEATDNSWHDSWKKGSSQRSFLFSARCMNKSLVLDIEDSLLKLLKTQRKVCVKNYRDNPQGGYSNKNCRDELLTAIWSVLMKKEYQYPLESYDCAYEKLLENSKLVSGHSAVCFSSNDLFVYFTEKISSKNLEQDIINKVGKEDSALLLNYPVVYLHIWKDSNNHLRVYTGEANELLRRTKQHDEYFDDIKYFNDVPEWHDSWQEAEQSWFVVFGHKSFNKSVILDLENRLIWYFRFQGYSVNGRENEQRTYGGCDFTHDRFKEIVAWLTDYALPKGAYTDLKSMAAQAPFLSSPLKALTQDQLEARDGILKGINGVLNATKNDQTQRTLFVVQGGAGTGKTVLAASLYYELLNMKIACCFVINQEDLLGAQKTSGSFLNIATERNKGTEIKESSRCLEENETEEPSPYHNFPFPLPLTADCYLKSPSTVVIVDEAHRLKTKGTGQGSKQHLLDIIKKTPVTVLMFDPKQFVISKRYWQAAWNDIGKAFNDYLQKNGMRCVDIKVHDLSTQMRMRCHSNTAKWLRALSTPGAKIEKMLNITSYAQESNYVIVRDASGYEIGIFKEKDDLRKLMNDHRQHNSPSCLMATYSWDKDSKSVVYEEMPWHDTGTQTKGEEFIQVLQSDKPQKKMYSVHNIQGFDLNYAGVILGRSVRYDIKTGMNFVKKVSGELVHRGNLPEHNNNKVYELISNEVGVLLSRGIKGIYIYAVEDVLREKLLESITPP